MRIQRATQWTVLLISILLFAVACGSGEPVELRPGDVAASGMVDGAEWTFYDGVAEVNGEGELGFTLSDDLIGGCGEFDGEDSHRIIGFGAPPEVGTHDVQVGFVSVQVSGSDFSFSSTSGSGTVTIDEVADGMIYGSIESNQGDDDQISGDFAALDCR